MSVKYIYRKLGDPNNIAYLTCSRPSYGEKSKTGDYYCNGKWYNKLGVEHNPQIAYLKEDGKLLTIDYEDSKPIQINLAAYAPDIVENSAVFKHLNVVDEFELWKEYEDVTNDIALNIEYRSSGKPIFIFYAGCSTSSYIAIHMIINGKSVATPYIGGNGINGNYGAHMSVLIPPYATYSFGASVKLTNYKILELK